jgi:NAD(P)-dependent dehydrogenase (short-subunit alcohol dehydrogenase family)
VEKTVLITGVSSGIGHALAEHYLDAGNRVLGLSRRTPEDLRAQARFQFVSVDLQDLGAIDDAVGGLFEDARQLDLILLNAGTLGQFGDLSQADLADLQQTMQVNVWANFALLKWIFGKSISVSQVVAISSGAAVNAHRGGSGYSLSKSAMNMLIALYALEEPQTHFTALAPGLVDTAMQDQLCGRPPDPRYPAIEFLRQRRNTADMPTPIQLAPRLATVIAKLPELVDSGAYADIREITLE